MRHLIYLILIMLVFSCQHKTNTLIGNLKNEGNKYSTQFSKPILVNLDTCKTKNVNFNKVFIVNKTFDKLGQIDTLLVSENLLSIKTAKFIQQEDETECCYSQLGVFNNNKRVFYKDSISITGMCNYDKTSNLLIIPIINDQYDDLSVTSSLYLCDVSTGMNYLVVNELTNCWFGLICNDGKSILYNDADKLIRYNFKGKTKKIIFNFDNPTISIFKLSLENSHLEIYYFDNFVNYIDVPMKKATMILTKPIGDY